MRRIFLPLVCLAAALSFSATDAALPQDDGASPRVISVATHSGEPVHQRLTLGLGKAVIVEMDTDTRDVLVSSPDIVDAVVRTPRRIYLMAQKGGQTNAFFFDGAGRQLLSLDIRVEKDVTDLGRLIHQAFPDSSIKVDAVNDNVVLSGHAANPLESSRAQDMAARFAGDPAKVVNMLQIGTNDQVMLKVRIAEVQRNIAKQLGFNFAGGGMVGGTPWGASTDNQFSLVGQALADLSGAQVGQVCNTASTAINPIAAFGGAGICNFQNNIQGSMKALERVGLIHILAEPNLTAVSGETAKFLAGGEFPVPAARDRDGNVTIVFKQFGVGLSFTPVVIGPGRISLQLSTEVSELTNTGSFTLQGATTSSNFTIPALNVRRAETTVELPSGGSFAIAGLMQHTTKQVLDAFPGLKDMPVLGALFRSRDFQNNETELVVVVTAYLVHPVQEAKLAAPTDGFVPPTDLETIFLGRLNAVYPHDKSAVTADRGQVGYIVQ
ncbi:MAG: type II and III secretion system protein family protein [Alphaproteobacteria bacterium]|nr:type II and III secretion system protein family protein [Alphaproteobacteria bacterium]